MAIWPTAVATDADLYVAKNSLQTTLATALGTSDVSVVLASATGFPVAGAVVIGNEVIFYTNISGSTLTGCTRGSDGTTAATHSIGVPVGAAVVAFHHNVLKDEVEAIETYLSTNLGTGATPLTASRALASNSSKKIVASSVLDTELAFLSGVTSAIQTQLNAKAPLASPTFTGTVVIPTPFTLGATSVTATGTEINRLVGVTSAIQTQLDAKATDSLVVHLAGTESVTGQKTMSALIATLAGNLVAGGFKATGLAAGSAAGDSLRFEQMKVVQWQYATNATLTQTTNTAFQSTSLSVAITPTSASNKILIFAFGQLSHSASGFSGCATIANGTTNLGATNGLQEVAITATGYGESPVPCAMFVKDEPASTSAQTYRVRIKTMSGSGTTSWLAGNVAFSLIIAIEVAS